MFANNNVRNANIGYIYIYFNCKYCPNVFHKKNFNFYSKLKTMKKYFFRF